MAIYVIDNLDYEDMHIDSPGILTPSTIEMKPLWNKVKPTKRVNLWTGGLCRSPSSDVKTFIRNLDYLSSIISHKYTKTVILGNFNFDLNLSKKSTSTKCLLHIKRSHDLHQIIGEPTRITSLIEKAN